MPSFGEDLKLWELIYCSWECKLGQILWRTVWHCLLKWKIHALSYSEISLLGIFPKELCAHTSKDIYKDVHSNIIHTESEVLVAQSCPTLCDPIECSLPGSSVHGILQARILEWVAILFSRGSSQPRDWTHDSCIAGGFFTVWAIYYLYLKTTQMAINSRVDKYIVAYVVGHCKRNKNEWTTAKYKETDKSHNHYAE